MLTKQARELGQQLASLIETGQSEKAQESLSPILAGPMAFRLLDQMGAPIGRTATQSANPFLDWIGTTRTEGGWVVIGSAIREWIPLKMAEAFGRTRHFILQADVWYATDSFGERVIGPALLYDFQPALELLKPWRQDTNRWVRRATGVACHFWAKRRRGAPDSEVQAQAWLDFVEPLFEERNWDALKGVGWGLKTLGRYYPDLVREWLIVQAIEHKRPFRSLILRKALTYLPEQDRQKVVQGLVSR
jgi:3-methyladenine DNA glycosylase AlkD